MLYILLIIFQNAPIERGEQKEVGRLLSENGSNLKTGTSFVRVHLHLKK